MKKLLKYIAALTLGAAAVTAAVCGTAGRMCEAEALAQEISLTCKAAYLADGESGMQLYAKDETKRLPIASMCKIMTLLLAFEAEEQGVFAYDDAITVSERAAGMGGSQVFLGAGLSYRADDLLKSIAVCSANDACVAIAERIDGSEGAFVDRMNARAEQLGAENTLFANCTGLPKETQYSCAKDVAIMLRALLGHEKYHEYCKIWLEDFLHPDGRTTQMTNTNRLIRTYRGCDGGKTGFTNEAGFCLAASAGRQDMHVVSVVIGASDSKTRFAESAALLDYAFDRFESVVLLKKDHPAERQAIVRGSETTRLPLLPAHTLAAVRRRGTQDEFTLEYCIEPLVAPVETGTRAGYAVMYCNGIEIARTDLLTQGAAKRFTWAEAYREGARHWNSK